MRKIKRIGFELRRTEVDPDEIDMDAIDQVTEGFYDYLAIRQEMHTSFINIANHWACLAVLLSNPKGSIEHRNAFRMLGCIK